MTEAAGTSGRLLNECGLPSSQVIKLLSADFSTTDDVKDMKPSELSQATGLSLKECVEVLSAAANSQHPSPVDMLQLYQLLLVMVKLTAVRLREQAEVMVVERTRGAVPATIAVLHGQVHVGLSEEQLRDLATKKDCIKTSRRDFPYVLAKGLTGGTTVSGTMVVAHRVGIPIFVTGGIGGVHRGAQTTMDISADLTELGRTPVCVVCAGVKSILDVGRTLEYLETQGVCVSVLGPDARFPDFFTRNSGFLAPSHVESPGLAALMVQKRAELSLDSGMLIAVPIPEEHEAEGHLIKEAIDQAVEEAASISGRDVTPFILSRVSEITAGQSLKSNIGLIKNNAKTGSQIAAEFARLTSPASRYVPPIQESNNSSLETEDSARPVVVGGSIVDFVVTVLEPQFEVGEDMGWLAAGLSEAGQGGEKR
ncbi:Pseudouridine-5'-phosphate glycosidase [Portunus trituberculatus]|uniref:Pseudouridine-5'-phosphate glycosidase n=1 Tax=Portunus trituberculatus TaxID=210409 RepID=A0A5B7CXT9_PORTR|nr:Pseudouridine-5'-phosphate glycosidase [Portunus trituberculatus]